MAITFKSRDQSQPWSGARRGPAWEKGKEGAIEDFWGRLAALFHLPVEPYPKRAAVFVARGLGGPYEVEVKLGITRSQNVSGDAWLVGTLYGVSIEGTCRSGVGDHTVRARITNPPEHSAVPRPDRLASRVDATPIAARASARHWSRSISSWAPSPPYRTHGVWVEVLRFLVGSRRLREQSVGGYREYHRLLSWWARPSIRYRPRDIEFYGVAHAGGAFSLRSYLLEGSSSCNCYDEAAAVQTLAGALGVIALGCS